MCIFTSYFHSKIPQKCNLSCSLIFYPRPHVLWRCYHHNQTGHIPFPLSLRCIYSVLFAKGMEWNLMRGICDEMKYDPLQLFLFFQCCIISLSDFSNSPRDNSSGPILCLCLSIVPFPSPPTFLSFIFSFSLASSLDPSLCHDFPLQSNNDKLTKAR